MTYNVFLNPEYESHFQREGYLVLDLLTAKDISDLLGTFSSVATQHEYDFFTSVGLRDFELRRFIHENISHVFERSFPNILSQYKHVLGSFVAKRAASENGKFPLHQDPTFVEEMKHTGLTIWCP